MNLQDLNIYNSEAFSLLQKGMKDRNAFEIVAALVAVQSKHPEHPVFDNFERFAEEQNE